METVETIERKMKIQRLFVRFILVLLVIALCMLIGWLISQSTYDGIEQHVFEIFPYHKPVLGHA